MRTWSDDNPKAGLMRRKRTAIIEAARAAFLETGYAETSVHRIAAAAGVSTKTLYRHFEGKDDLFSAVMLDACSMPAPDGSHDFDQSDPSWYAHSPRVALPTVGTEYLHTVLSPTGLSLYRVVTRDSPRFPELGRRYRQVVEFRTGLLARYLDLRAPGEGWKLAHARRAAGVFVALLDADLFEQALHGIRQPTDKDITDRANAASGDLLALIENGLL